MEYNGPLAKRLGIAIKPATFLGKTDCMSRCALRYQRAYISPGSIGDEKRGVRRTCSAQLVWENPWFSRT
jgi:hypothetical protein